MSPVLASMEKFPSKSVVTPALLPITLTVAPGSGTPLSSVIVPVMVCCRELRVALL